LHKHAANKSENILTVFIDISSALLEESLLIAPYECERFSEVFPNLQCTLCTLLLSLAFMATVSQPHPLYNPPYHVAIVILPHYATCPSLNHKQVQFLPRNFIPLRSKPTDTRLSAIMVMLSTRNDRLERSAKRDGGEDLNRHLTVSCRLLPEGKSSLSHWQYKYKFTPPSPQWDTVIHHIKLVIREPKREFIGFAPLHVRVHPTNDSGPFWPIDPRFPLYDGMLCTFVMDDGAERSRRG
jgi:hypothetical protein